MRLINTTSFHLEYFNDCSDARYAALSHTWGNDADEVSFSDMANPTTAFQKPGWAKIQKTCEIARLNYDLLCLGRHLLHR